MPGNDCNGEKKARTITWRQENITTKTMCERTGRAKSTIMKVLAASSELEPNVIHGGGMPKKTSNATDGLLKMYLNKNPRLTASKLTISIQNCSALSVSELSSTGYIMI